MKITKTQEKILTDAKKTIDVLKKYKNHADFFNNSRNEQTTFTTAYYCNSAYNTAEKYQINNPEQWAKMEKISTTQSTNKLFSFLQKLKASKRYNAQG